MTIAAGMTDYYKDSQRIIYEATNEDFESKVIAKPTKVRLENRIGNKILETDNHNTPPDINTTVNLNE